MAIPQVTHDMNGQQVIVYTVPQSIMDAAQGGFVYLHVVWFLRRQMLGTTGQWIGEWAGYAPTPSDAILKRQGDARLRALDRWTQQVQRQITPYGAAWPTVDSAWNIDTYEACPQGGAVCLDVTRFGWPVGDHVWHRWDDVRQALDWPDSSGHRFIEIDLRSLRVVAQQHSHRPVRDAVPGQKVFDITGTMFEHAWGGIHGRFALMENGLWGFDPDNTALASGRPLVLPSERKVLTEARIDLSLIGVLPQRDVIRV